MQVVVYDTAVALLHAGGQQAQEFQALGRPQGVQHRRGGRGRGDGEQLGGPVPVLDENRDRLLVRFAPVVREGTAAADDGQDGEEEGLPAISSRGREFSVADVIRCASSFARAGSSAKALRYQRSRKAEIRSSSRS